MTGFRLRRQTTGVSHQRCSPFSLLIPPLRGSSGGRGGACLPSCQCVRWRHPGPSAALYLAPVHGWTLGQAGFAGQYGSNWRGRSAFRSADAAPPPSSVGGQCLRHPDFATVTPQKTANSLVPHPFQQHIDADKSWLEAVLFIFVITFLYIVILFEISCLFKSNVMWKVTI